MKLLYVEWVDITNNNNEWADIEKVTIGGWPNDGWPNFIKGSGDV